MNWVGVRRCCLVVAGEVFGDHVASAVAYIHWLIFSKFGKPVEAWTAVRAMGDRRRDDAFAWICASLLAQHSCPLTGRTAPGHDAWTARWPALRADLDRW
jgi:hypothetical protein